MNKLTKQRAPFTQVPNELLTDTTISLKAKGLYALMYSKPDNWTFYEGALARESRDGKEAVSTGLDELVRAGWLRRSGGREEGSNRFCAYDYELMVSRDVVSVTDFPSRESRDGKPATNKTVENKKDETPPKSPKGPCGWEENSGFMSVMAAYQNLNPSRVNPAKAWAVWQEHSLDGHSEQILASLPSFAALHQWKKEGGQFIPSFAKWLGDGAWRTTKIGLKVSAEELEERRKIHSAGMSALARVTSCQRLGTEPEALDVQAVARMREQQAAYGNASA